MTITSIFLDYRSVFLAVLFLLSGAGHLSLWLRLHDHKYRPLKAAAWVFMAFVWAGIEFKDAWPWFAANQRLFVSLGQTALVASEIYALFYKNEVAKWIERSR